MLKFIKVTNETTKEVACNLNDSMTSKTAVKLGLSAEKQEVELGYDNHYYLLGYAPVKPLKEIKEEKITELKQARDDEEQSYFEYNGHKYDSDAVSIQRIEGATKSAEEKGDAFQGQMWIDYDDNIVSLSLQDLKNMCIALADHSNDCHLKYATLKAEVMACETAEKVEAVQWN